MVDLNWKCHMIKIKPVEKDLTKLPMIETLESSYPILDSCLDKYRIGEDRLAPLFEVGEVSKVKKEEVPAELEQAAKDAIESCPTSAIEEVK